MTKTLLVMHENTGDYYRMTKTEFENLPVIGEHIYNSDGVTYLIEDVVALAGYDSTKGVATILVVKPVAKDDPANTLYGLDVEKDLF